MSAEHGLVLVEQSGAGAGGEAAQPQAGAARRDEVFQPHDSVRREAEPKNEKNFIEKVKKRKKSDFFCGFFVVFCSFARGPQFDEHDIISALRALGAVAPADDDDDAAAAVSSDTAKKGSKGKRAPKKSGTQLVAAKTTRGRVVKPPVKLRDAPLRLESAKKKRGVAAGAGVAKKKAKKLDDDDDDDDDGDHEDRGDEEDDNDNDNIDDNIDDDDNNNHDDDNAVDKSDVSAAVVPIKSEVVADAMPYVELSSAPLMSSAMPPIFPFPSATTLSSALMPPMSIPSASSTTFADFGALGFDGGGGRFVGGGDEEEDDEFGDEGGAEAGVRVKRKYTKRSNLTAPRMSAGPSSQVQRRRMVTERKRDFKPGSERRAHRVSSDTLVAPPAWTEVQCGAVIQDVGRRAQLRAQQIEQLAREGTSDESVVRAMQSNIADDVALLHAVSCACVLPLPLLASFFRDVVFLNRQQAQAEALLAACVSGSAVCRLLVLSDLPPPPTIPFKGKPSQVPEYKVHLFVACAVNQPPPSLSGAVVQAASKCSAKEFTKAPTTLTNATAPLASDRTATFSSLVIEESSRMEFVALEFSVAKPAALAQLAEAVESAPMIVVTNESQWPGAAKRLLWNDTFVDEQVIPWPLFANMLNMHMICGLQQTLDSAPRPLYDWELRYLHRNPRWFNGEKLVKREQALAFWNFFGAALTALRFKRHCFTMWSRALVLGFISREKAASLLAGERVGTFCVRFSESLPGAFAVAYVVNDDERDVGNNDAITLVQVPSKPGEVTVVKHFLILPTQLGHNRTLPDFIRDKSEFKYICALRSTQSDSITAITDKDATLAPFYKHDRLEGKAFSGYVSTAN
jgi:hypothetical protein